METKKLKLKRLYDETAVFYDKRYTEIQRAKHRVVLKYLPKRMNRVLDLGCGTGLLLRELCKRGKLVIGVDVSEGMLRKAKVRNETVNLMVADADNLPFRDGIFDCVVSVTLLQNMPDPAHTVREFARVLKRKGLGILTSLKRKHSIEALEDWAKRAGLRIEASGEIEASEDVFCVVRR
jgi:malonyl-CoA O-methyltransferase